MTKSRVSEHNILERTSRRTKLSKMTTHESADRLLDLMGKMRIYFDTGSVGLGNFIFDEIGDGWADIQKANLWLNSSEKTRKATEIMSWMSVPGTMPAQSQIATPEWITERRPPASNSFRGQAHNADH